MSIKACCFSFKLIDYLQYLPSIGYFCMIIELLNKTMKSKIVICSVLLFSAFSVSAQTDEYSEVDGYGVSEKLNSYKKVRLTTDLSHLNQSEKDALYFMIEAAKAVNPIFWKQTFGDDYQKLLDGSSGDLKSFIELNYGPWDRLNNDAPFVKGFGPKPLGANYYAPNLDPEKLKEFPEEELNNQYSVVMANEWGDIQAERYSIIYFDQIGVIIDNLAKASERLRESDKSYAQYLMQRLNSLSQDDYMPSDVEWLRQKTNKLDIIIGPIESYDDKLHGIRTSFESYVMVRDPKWSKKLAKYLKELPDLQKDLPVDSAYKTETPGGSGDQLAVFDAVYYAGDCNSGSKTIAVNLPNDEEIQKNEGTRRSQIRNVMKAKFDEIVVPISEKMIVQDQQKHVNFNSFFNNVMFHEVAHGLGIKNLVGSEGTVKSALGTLHNTIEECKADVLGLWMVTQLVDKKELDGVLDDYYVTFVSSIFRSVRFGAGSAHGKANMIVYNTLVNEGAIKRTENGLYEVNVNKMRKSIEDLAGRLLKHQGDGNAISVGEYVAEYAAVSSVLKTDISEINKQNIPVDIRFEQGQEVLGLSVPKPMK